MMVVAPQLMGLSKTTSLGGFSGNNKCLELLVLARIEGPGDSV
jgi:hypothetical protein